MIRYQENASPGFYLYSCDTTGIFYKYRWHPTLPALSYDALQGRFPQKAVESIPLCRYPQGRTPDPSQGILSSMIKIFPWNLQPLRGDLAKRTANVTWWHNAAVQYSKTQPWCENALLSSKVIIYQHKRCYSVSARGVGKCPPKKSFPKSRWCNNVQYPYETDTTGHHSVSLMFPFFFLFTRHTWTERPTSSTATTIAINARIIHESEKMEWQQIPIPY